MLVGGRCTGVKTRWAIERVPGPGTDDHSVGADSESLSKRHRCAHRKLISIDGDATNVLQGWGEIQYCLRSIKHS